MLTSLPADLFKLVNRLYKIQTTHTKYRGGAIGGAK
jgi:hypothetical protein